MATDTKQYFGQTDLTSDQGDWNRMRFAMQQQMLSLNTSLPVRVLSVQAGGLGPVGTVGIQILVDQVTGNGMTVPHGEIVNVPYCRMQGGTNAVIIDPKVGDIGMACFASRDISAVKNVRKNAPPGSLRAHDFSDAMYVGGFLNGTPVQYIQFTDGGIIVHSPSAVTVQAPVVDVQASTSVNITSPITNIAGNLSVTGNSSFVGTFTNNGKNIGSTHTHIGPATAPTGPISNTGQPI